VKILLSRASGEPVAAPPGDLDDGLRHLSWESRKAVKEATWGPSIVEMELNTLDDFRFLLEQYQDVIVRMHNNEVTITIYDDYVE
jgi:hypothetical protein